ncbi:MAG: M28 family peptidase [Planctomycetota bacterium]|nr:MAG: M28 family peptidase [Planctomycetota bacterium]
MAILAAALLLTVQAPDPSAVDPARLRADLRRLCAGERLAGGPGGGAAADLAAEVFAAAGLRVERTAFQVHAPRQTGQELLILPEEGPPVALDLHERGFAEDPGSSEKVPPMHGLTAAGVAEGPVIHAGFGRAEDFAALREAGVELTGAIALIRYGRIYRGLKVANAEAAGCAGALLYTDDRDDGSARGPVLPEGPWRPPDGIQRGSVFNGDGDPATPGWASLPGADRRPPAAHPGMVGIPSLPIGSANARAVLGGAPPERGARGRRVRLRVEQDPRPVEIEDVLGWIDGSVRPDEWVLAGAHRDSWGPGAVDNGSGTVVLFETARVLGQALAQGWRPDRTLVLATWDAEEWGLMGSTEWVELRREELIGRGVAYLNLDTVASGPSFGATCTPGLAEVLRAACTAEGVSPPDSLGAPGGGSDHVPFLELAGMEVGAFGFHGASGAYHSAYDTPWLVETHLDPDFAHHAAAARLLIRLLTDLSGSGCRVDGLRGWSDRIGAAVAGLEADAEERLSAAAADLAVAVQEAGARAPHPHRLLRFFLPSGGGRLLLWRSAGYGSAWFPELAGSGDRSLALARAERALRRAARAIRAGAPAPAAGRQ